MNRIAVRRCFLLLAGSLALAEERRATAGDEHRRQSARQRLAGGGGIRRETGLHERNIMVILAIAILVPTNTKNGISMGAATMAWHDAKTIKFFISRRGNDEEANLVTDLQTFDREFLVACESGIFSIRIMISKQIPVKPASGIGFIIPKYGIIP